jgi:hypothetical protein
MTLSAGISACPGSVDEMLSLVSRDCDESFLWRPRDVYILFKYKDRSVTLGQEQMGHQLPAFLITVARQTDILTFSVPLQDSRP